jgi:DNA polymerase-3 subunit gamma/tau
MKALYRRYRPKTLAEVVGQEQITSVLEKSLKNHKISHAYLFIGPRGTGKTSVARILAHEINGFKYELEDDYLDIIEIDAASNTGVDNIRDLRERAIIAPTKGKFKVYIIDEVHMLSKSAFNALLKTLEEPPEHVVFIMATTDAHKVPITITSRSQVYTFKLADPSTMFDHLKDICKKEKIDITDEAIKIVVKRGGGSFRDSLSLLDQISTMSDGKITGDMLVKALGLPQEAIVESLLAAYGSGDLAKIRQNLTELSESGIKAEITANELIDAIIANPEPQLLPLLDKLIDVSRSSNPAAKLLLALCQNQGIVAPRQIVQAPPIQRATAPLPPKPAQPAPQSAEPAPAPEAEPPKAPTPTPVPNDASANEIWQRIIAHIAEKHPLLAPDVVTSKYTLKSNVLKIYTGNYAKAKNIDKRKSSISEILPPDIVVEVTRETLIEDPDVANITAIMGGGEEIDINA